MLKVWIGCFLVQMSTGWMMMGLELVEYPVVVPLFF
jgi:hypothetical protein